MGQIANQMALELFFKIQQRIKDKREEKKQKKAECANETQSRKKGNP